MCIKRQLNRLTVQFMIHWKTYCIMFPSVAQMCSTMSTLLCRAMSVPTVQRSLFTGFQRTTNQRLSALNEQKPTILKLLSPTVSSTLPKSFFGQYSPIQGTQSLLSDTGCQPMAAKCQPVENECQPMAIKCQPADDKCQPATTPLRVTLIEGRGIGPVVCLAAQRVLEAAGVAIEWERHTLSMHREPHTGRAVMNAAVLESANSTRLVLRGPDSGLAPDGSHISAPLTLHKALGAFVGVRLFSTIGGYEPFGRVRLVNIRENVSGEYSEIEHTVVPGVVQSIKTVSRTRSEAVARFAFDYAVNHGHTRVTALHKANAMRLSDGMFLRACRSVAANYTDRVVYNEELLDKFCLLVANDPSRYDVLLTPSLYGAFASAVCSSLAGGPKTVSTAAYGRDGITVFGTMDHVTGIEYQDRCDAMSANPTGMIRAAAWMLSHVGMMDPALRVNEALMATIRQGVRTHDMGGIASCIQFTETVVGNLH